MKNVLHEKSLTRAKCFILWTRSPRLYKLEVINLGLINKFLSATSLKEDDQKPFYDSEPDQYEGYPDTKLPDGHTPNGDKCDPKVIRVNDTPKRQLWDKLKSGCNDIGRLVKFITNDIDFERFAF